MSEEYVAGQRRLLTVVGAAYPLLAVGGLATYFLVNSAIGLVLLAGVLSFLLFTSRPIVPASLLLLLWATFVPPKFGEVGLGALHASIAELVLFTALVAVLRRRIVDGLPRRGYRLTGPITAFLAASAFGTGVGVYNGESIRSAFEAIRILLVLASFFVFREAFHGRSVVFGRWLVAAATLGCAMSVIGIVTGLPISGRVIDHVITNNVLVNIERIDPPVLRLESLVLILLLCGGILRGRPVLRIGIILLLSYVELISFTRSTWLPLLLVGLVVPVVVSVRPRWLVLLERSILLAGASAVLIALAASGTLGLTGTTAFQRLDSTVHSSTLSDNSLSDRTQNELANAIPRIAANPITGVGLNLPYGAVNADYGPLLDVISATDRTFIHNTPAGIWLWLGLPGVLATLWLAIRTGTMTWRVYQRCPRRIVGAPVGAAAGLLVLSVQSTFQTNLLYQPALLTYAAGLAFLDVWVREHRVDESPAPVTT